MVWRGVAWRCVAWCGAAWRGAVWRGVAWCGAVRRGVEEKPGGLVLSQKKGGHFSKSAREVYV